MFEDTPNFFSQLELSLYRIVLTMMEQVLLILLVCTLVLLVVTVLLAFSNHLRQLRAAAGSHWYATLAPLPAIRKKLSLPRVV